MAGILDHAQVVRAGNLTQPVHIGHVTAQVHRDDGLRPGGNLAGDVVGVDAQCVRLDVGKDGDRPVA